MKTSKLVVFILLVVSNSSVFAVPDHKKRLLQVKKKAPQVKLTNNLLKDGRLSARKSLPILLMFSATDCSYCELLENEILKPMLLSGDYVNKVIIRKVNIDEDSDMVRDFNGKKKVLSDIVLRYNIHVTPTMVFVDKNGKELTKRMIGINTVEYYGGDVDNAIDKSIKKLRSNNFPDSAQK